MVRDQVAQAAGVAHYEELMSRWSIAIQEARAVRRGISRGKDLALSFSPTRKCKLGMLAGAAGGSPTHLVDARVLEMAPGSRTSTHRHSYDTVVFVVSGAGYSVVDGQRYDWSERDSLFIPADSWHYHGSDGAQNPARLLATTDAPLRQMLRSYELEDIGNREPPPRSHASTPSAKGSGATFYEEDLASVRRLQAEKAATRILTRWSEVELKLNQRGARSAFLIDPAVGYETGGLTIVVNEIPAGVDIAAHRHGGEWIIYVVEGKGYSIIDEQKYPWEAGDALIVDHFCWHQHFNTDPAKPATYIRMGLSESINLTMRIMMDPIVTHEHRPDDERVAGLP